MKTNQLNVRNSMVKRLIHVELVNTNISLPSPCKDNTLIRAVTTKPCCGILSCFKPVKAISSRMIAKLHL